MGDQFVSVGVVSGNFEAEIIKSYLQSRGIPCILSQEALGRVYGLGFRPLAEVEILVPHRHGKAAREAMKSYWESAGKTSEP